MAQFVSHHRCWPSRSMNVAARPVSAHVENRLIQDKASGVAEKSLTIVGQGTTNTIVDSHSLGASSFRVFEIVSTAADTAARCSRTSPSPEASPITAHWRMLDTEVPDFVQRTPSWEASSLKDRVDAVTAREFTEVAA